MTTMTFRGRTFRVPSSARYYDDEAEVRDAFWLIEEGDSVIDVGARYGAYTLPALACGARVIAVDANASVFPEVLLTAAALNGFDEVAALRVALYDRTPYPPALTSAGAADFPEDTPWSTLDEIVDGKVDWVKLDVEGAELGVLRGGMTMLRESHPRLLIEDHHRVYEWVRRNRIEMQVEALLRSLDYEVEHVPYLAPDTGAPRDFMVAT